MKNLYYNPSTNALVNMIDYDVVRYEYRNKFPEDVECFVVFHDLANDRVHIQEGSEFDDDFIAVDLNNVDKVQEWYGFDDIQFAEFKKILIEIIEYKE